MPDSSEKKEAKSKKTAPQRLLELSRNPDPSVQYAVAGNVNAPVGALEYLAGHGKFTILKAVAGNPNVTLPILFSLAGHKQWTVCQAVAWSELAPVTVLVTLAGHADRRVRGAVLTNVNCSPKLFEALARDAEMQVRLSVARKYACPPAVLEGLASDPDAQVRGEVAANHNMPLATLRTLASDPDAYVRSGVAGNRNTPLATVQTLAGDADVHVRVSTVRNLGRASDHKPLIALARDPDAQVRSEVASWIEWHPELHDHLVTDADETVRLAIAYHYAGDLPDTAALVLARDESDEVREGIARCERLSKAVLEVLVNDPNPEVRRCLAYVTANEVPAWVLERLASDADRDVRWQVANHWRTPKTTLQQLEDDPDETVRSSARDCLARSWRSA